MLVWFWCKFGATLYRAILKRSESASLLVSERVQIALRAFCEKQNRVRSTTSVDVKLASSICFNKCGGSICKNSAVQIIKWSEATNLFVSERVQIALRAFCEKQNEVRSTTSVDVKLASSICFNKCGGSICKNSAALFTLGRFCGII